MFNNSKYVDKKVFCRCDGTLIHKALNMTLKEKNPNRLNQENVVPSLI